MKIRFLKITITFLLFSLQLVSAQKGLEIYLVKQPFPNYSQKDTLDCSYCFDLNLENLYDSALLIDSDIKRFDWEKQQVFLTDNGLLKIKSLEVPLQGLAVAFILDGEPIYGFWFWNEYSSFGCDWIVTYPKLGFVIEFGLPKGKLHGLDPRFNNKLEAYVKINKN